MRIHIIGVCGTFMAGVARIARELGHEVEGSDVAFYPPMSDQLDDIGITCHKGYEASAQDRPADLYIVGNAISRGNPLMESVLREHRPFVSAPQWLHDQVLHRRRVVAVAGTHGKTTVVSMVISLLEHAGVAPGFLVGGLHRELGVSARLGAGDHFVVEADEYDSAFFDKRPKFLHYWPEVLVLNNLEFDHADIYPDLGAIEQQFRYLLRTVTPGGVVIAGDVGGPLDDILANAPVPVERFGAGAREWVCKREGSRLCVHRAGEMFADGDFSLTGDIARSNATAAVAAVAACGVTGAAVGSALSALSLPARRMELVAEVSGVRVFDDFAHHPTAIRCTLSALRESYPDSRILAVFEPRSNTMKLGVWNENLAECLSEADMVFGYSGDVEWDFASALAPLGAKLRVEDAVPDLAAAVAESAREGDVVVMMSNGDFGGMRRILPAALQPSAIKG